MGAHRVAFLFREVIGGVPVFVILLCIGPYTAELFPVSQAGRGLGLFQSANGSGRFIGPLSLAFIAGANNYMTPTATANAVFPGFVFLACCGLATGLALTFLGFETHGKSLKLGVESESDAMLSTGTLSQRAVGHDTR